MTFICYPDCEASSPDGRFTLEARSPHNGTIPHRDGRPATDEFASRYRHHQRDFRYRLLDHSAGGAEPRVVWERWQGQGEDSPRELRVSDDGWAILRTHGFEPEVIAVTPDGHDALRVRIRGEGEEEEEDEEQNPRRPEERRYVWRARRLSHSTAGVFWSRHSWPYFLRRDGTDFFVWWVSSGQRLVLDLTHAALLTEGDPAWAGLARAMDEQEAREASALLSDLSAHMDEVQRLLAQRDSGSGEDAPSPLEDKLECVMPDLLLAGVHRIQACLPFLHQWEAIDHRLYSTSSHAFGAGTSWMLEAQAFRPVAQHALRRLWVQPQGHAAYYFYNGDQGRFAMPEQVTGRRQRAEDLDPGMSAEQVLRWMGSPDFVQSQPHDVGKQVRWTEDWEYDFLVQDRWVTLRLSWEAHPGHGRIASIEKVPASWLQTDEREQELLPL